VKPATLALQFVPLTVVFLLLVAVLRQDGATIAEQLMAAAVVATLVANVVTAYAAAEAQREAETKLREERRRQTKDRAAGIGQLYLNQLSRMEHGEMWVAALVDTEREMTEIEASLENEDRLAYRTFVQEGWRLRRRAVLDDPDGTGRTPRLVSADALRELWQTHGDRLLAAWRAFVEGQ